MVIRIRGADPPPSAGYQDAVIQVDQHLSRLPVSRFIGPLLLSVAQVVTESHLIVARLNANSSAES